MIQVFLNWLLNLFKPPALKVSLWDQARSRWDNGQSVWRG